MSIRPIRSIHHWPGGIASVLVLLGAMEARAQSASPGFGLEEITIAPAGAFVGGFEVLSNGNYAVFDGVAVNEVAASDGAFVRTLHTPPGFVFGAFLTLSPDGSKLYFGESSDGTVVEIDLATLQFVEVIDTVYPYDLAFDPQGRPFLSYAFNLTSGSFVALCDFANESLDDVISSPDASGPLAFDDAGNLYTATPDTTSFPPPADATEVLRFAKADLDSAIGPGEIGVDVGVTLGLVDGVSGIALDGTGDVLLSDPNSGVLVEIDRVTLAETVIAQAGLFVAFLYLRHLDGARGTFEPWQPADAGETLVVRSDFFSFNGLTRVRPARAQLATNPASPIPAGSFDLDVTGAAPSGFGLMAIAMGVTASEIELRNKNGPGPLYLGLDFSGGVTILPVPIDAAGALHVTLANPGLGGVTVALQMVVGASPSGLLHGTTEALELTLQ